MRWVELDASIESKIEYLKRITTEESPQERAQRREQAIKVARREAHKARDSACKAEQRRPEKRVARCDLRAGR